MMYPCGSLSPLLENDFISIIGATWTYILNPGKRIFTLKKLPPILSQVPVAHACNHSYSGGRDQEDQGLKPAWANSLRPYLENTHHRKKARGVARVIDCLPIMC
jgi:hypothetical protein